jgi:integrase
MALMKYLRQRSKGGTYYVVMTIPTHARHLFGERKQVWISTRTKNEIDALRVGAPLVAEMKAKIGEAAKLPDVAADRLEEVSFSRRVRTPIHPEDAFAALARWRTAEIERHYEAAFNGSLPAWAVTEHWFEHTDRLSALKTGAFVPHFSERLSDALNSQGVVCDQNHPALRQIPIRREFAAMWAEIEERYCEFGRRDYKGWREARAALVGELPAPQLVASAPPTMIPQLETGSTLKLLDLFDRWATSKQIDDQKRQRGYVMRLSQFLGDADITAVTSGRLDDFKVQLRRFPNTKRPVEDIPFDEVIRMFEREEAAMAPGVRAPFRRLGAKTIWNWFRTLNNMFRYAVDTELVTRNPVASVMPDLEKQPTAPRLIYDGDDIAAIFSKPLFQGCSAAKAYRDKPGSVIQRDSAYWLPIFCLWEGCRLEEIGAAMAADVKVQDGLPFLDLRYRELKNLQSQRMLPLHPKIIDLGFLDYARSQPKSGRLFPELAHDERPTLGPREKRKASTRLYSKWWGRWCSANAPVAGQGFDHPHKVFHSLRHTFKRTIREAGVHEELSDLLTGHQGNDHVGRAYGQGVSLAVLAREIAKVSYPTFPVLP